VYSTTYSCSPDPERPRTCRVNLVARQRAARPGRPSLPFIPIEKWKKEEHLSEKIEVNEGETDPLAARLAAKARGVVAVARRHGVGPHSPDSETERGSRPPRVWLSAALPAPIPGRSAARGGGGARAPCAVLRRAGRVDGCWWTYAGGWMQWTVGSFVSAATFAPFE
jgi:hypothetical protein